MGKMRRNIEAEIQALLAEPQYAGHPLYQALADLFAEYQERLHQIERITRISDHYQSAARATNLSLSERYQRQLKYLNKVARISDGYQSLMRDRQAELKAESQHDALTGLGNRRLLENRLKTEAARLDRQQRPLTLAMVDADRFKAINDTYGHDAGDKVLIAIARALEGGLREYDICGRWGGEEFLILMPELDAAVGSEVVERLRQAIAALQVRIGDIVLSVTASFGLAQRRPGEDVVQTLARADQALLAAKRAGRNCWEIAD